MKSSSRQKTTWSTSRARLAMLAVAAAAAAGLIGGCTEVVVPEGAAPPVRVRDTRATQAAIQYNTVAILDKSLQDWSSNDEGKRYARLAVEETNSRRSPTGTLEAYAVFRNRTDRPMQIEARGFFYDSAKLEAEPPTAWTRLFLPPQSVATYKALSTKVQEISFYRIEVREGR